MSWQGIKIRWQSAWEDGSEVAKKLAEDVRLELEPTINYLSRLGKFEIVLELIAKHRIKQLRNSRVAFTSRNSSNAVKQACFSSAF